MSDISQLCEEISELSKTLKAQGKAIQALAESNANLAAVVAEYMADEIADEDGDLGAGSYLDGTPLA